MNGTHNEDDDNFCAPLSRGSRDPLLTNGYLHPVNGALKPQDLTEHLPQVVDAESHRPNNPQSGHNEKEQLSNLSCTGSNLHQRPSVSTAAPVEEHVPYNMQNELQPKPTCNPGTSAETSNLQNQTSKVRLNGSYHTTSNSSHTDCSKQSGSKLAAHGAEAGIISEFFSHSRLHHISTWRNEFSEYVNTLQTRRRAAGGAVFSGKEKLRKLKANCHSGSML